MARAIILAAGMGTRLRPLTDTRPKCLVELAGRPLLDRQLDALRAAGVEDIHIVGGYLAEQLERPGLTRHLNPDYASTNMVHTLFCAEPALTGDQDLLIAYGDIVYEPGIVQQMLACDAPLCLAVDLAWRDYWQARMEDPLADAETLKLTPEGHVRELGRKPQSYADIEGQYIGLIKVRADHVRRLGEIRNAMDREARYDGKDFANMFMTSFLQHLIDIGIPLRAVPIRNGWLEVDAPEDLEVDVARFYRF